MAEDLTIRITELPGADPLAGIELIPLVQGGVTKTRSATDIVYEGGLQDHVDAPDPHPQYAFRVKNNLTAIADPTASNDETEGYSKLSRWVNTSTGEFFLCTSAATGAANWQKASLTIDELGALALSDNASGVPITDSGANYTATDVEGALAEEADARQAHEARTDNPHSVTYTQTGAEQAGVAQSIMDTHEAAVDPHSQYTTEAEAEQIALSNAITFSVAIG